MVLNREDPVSTEGQVERLSGFPKTEAFSGVRTGAYGECKGNEPRSKPTGEKPTFSYKKQS